MTDNPSVTRRRSKLLSPRGWLIVAVSAVVTPLLFGVWPNSAQRLFAFLMLAWMGGFMGGAAVMILGDSGKAETPPVPKASQDDGPTS